MRAVRSGLVWLVFPAFGRVATFGDGANDGGLANFVDEAEGCDTNAGEINRTVGRFPTLGTSIAGPVRAMAICCAPRLAKPLDPRGP
jgi:hypothetical protein